MAVQYNTNQVSWQSAYWALVPLAVNAMVQASGRICNFDQRYRFYLRSSPLVCIADFAGFAVRTVTYSWKTRSLQLGLIKAVRVKNIHQEDDPIRVQALEKIPPLRFVLFALAAAQAIKLFGCTGLPWTIVFASFYFIPYVVYEIVAIFGPRSDHTEGYGPLDFDSADRLLDRIDQALGFEAIILQSGCFWWIIYQLLFPAGSEIEGARSETIYQLLRFLDKGVGVLCWVNLLSWTMDFAGGSWRGTLFEAVWYLSYPTLSVVLIALPIWRRDWQLFLSRLLCSLEMYLFICFVLYCLSFGMEKVWSNWRKDVLLLERDEPWSFTAYFCFTFFVLMLTLSLFGYAYLYSPEGSNKPNWVNVLG